MKRVFIALDISNEARSATARHIDALRADVPAYAATWIRAEKLHVTIRFVGNCERTMLDRIGEVSAKCASETRPFVLNLSGTGVFPTAGKPRILWIGISDQNSDIQSLKACLESGSQGKHDTFTPHLTIGRVKDTSHSRPLTNRHLNSTIPPVEFVADGLTIYESTLLPTGSVYNVLSRHPFRLD